MKTIVVKQFFAARFFAFQRLALVAALALPLVAPITASAEIKPVVVVSFVGYDALMSDLNFIGELGGTPQLSQSVEGILALVTRAQGLAGLDKKKPIGATVSLSEAGQPQVVVYVPVTDSGKLLDALQGVVPTVEDLGDGYSELKPVNGPPVIMKESKGWAFLSNEKENLADVPTDPAKLLGDLPKKYDLAVQLNVRNVPPPLIEFAVGQIRQAAELGLRNADEQQKALVQAQLEQVEEVLQEFDHLLLGCAVDSKTRSMYLGVGMQVVEGGKLSNQITSAIKAGKATKLAGLADEDAVINFHFSSPVTEDDQKVILDALSGGREQMVKKIDEIEDAAMRDVVQGMAKDVMDVAEATIKSGRMNGGAVLFGEGPFELVVGAIVADGKKLEGVLKKAVEVFGQAPGAPPIKLNAAEHGGVTFHTVTFPVADDEVAQFFGSEMTVAVGFGADRVLIGAGEEPVDTASEVLDVSKEDAGEKFPAGQLDIQITPLLAFLVENDQIDEKTGQLVVDSLEESGDDHINLTSDLVPNGSQARLEVEEGILKALSKLMLKRMQGGR